VKDGWGCFCCHMTPPTNMAVNWWACVTGLLLMAFAIFFCRFLVVHISPTRTGESEQSPPAEPHADGRHIHTTGLLPGSFETLLSLPRCHAAFGTMPHITRSLFDVHRTLPLFAPRTPRVEFWRGRGTTSIRKDIKVKLSRYRHADDKRERICSSYSFLTSALDGG
jgi:hypothetical protein